MESLGQRIETLCALGGAAQRIEHQPVNQRVAGLMLSQGTCLGCRLGPGMGMCNRQLIDVSLPLYLFPSPLSLKINK